MISVTEIMIRAISGIGLLLFGIDTSSCLFERCDGCLYGVNGGNRVRIARLLLLQLGDLCFLSGDGGLLCNDLCLKLRYEGILTRQLIEMQGVDRPCSEWIVYQFVGIEYPYLSFEIDNHDTRAFEMCKVRTKLLYRN